MLYYSGIHVASRAPVLPFPTHFSADEYLNGECEHDDTGVEEPGNRGRPVMHTVVVEQVTCRR